MFVVCAMQSTAVWLKQPFAKSLCFLLVCCVAAMAEVPDFRTLCLEAQLDLEERVDRLARLERDIAGLTGRYKDLLPFMGVWETPLPEFAMRQVMDFLGDAPEEERWHFYPELEHRDEDPVLPHDDGHYQADVVLADLSYFPTDSMDYWRHKTKYALLQAAIRTADERMAEIRAHLGQWQQYELVILEEVFPHPPTPRGEGGDDFGDDGGGDTDGDEDVDGGEATAMTVHSSDGYEGEDGEDDDDDDDDYDDDDDDLDDDARERLSSIGGYSREVASMNYVTRSSSGDAGTEVDVADEGDEGDMVEHGGGDELLDAVVGDDEEMPNIGDSFYSLGR